MSKISKRFVLVLAITMLMAFAVCNTAFAAADATADTAPEDTVLEEITADVSQEVIEETFAIEEAPVAEESNPEALAELSATDLSFIPGEIIVLFEAGKGSLADGYAKELGGEVKALNTLPGVGDAALIKISPLHTVKDAITAYNGKAGVRYAEPNFKVTPQSSPASESTDQAASKQAAYTDPLVNDQWYINKINADKAISIIDALPAREKVRVVVLDTEMDIEHEDLVNIVNKDLSRVFINGKNEPYGELLREAEHGTHVGGIIAAQSNNGKGVAGVASGSRNQVVELISGQVLGAKVDSNYNTVLGVAWAIECNADIINMSLGLLSPYPYAYKEDVRLLEEVINEAVKSGTTVVCGAGNDDTTEFFAPGDFSSTINVIATIDYPSPKNTCKAQFSNYGAGKNVSAPGDNILSTVPGNKYTYFNGTSMASPVVSGVAALMKYANPDITPLQIMKGIERTATDLYYTGYDVYTAWGNINAEAAVKYALDLKPDPPIPTIPAPQDMIVTKTTANSVTLKWSKLSEMDGYAIFRSEAKYKSDYSAYKVIAKIDSSDSASYVDKGLDSGKKYCYSIASYIKSNDKIEYSPFGNTLYARTK